MIHITVQPMFPLAPTVLTKLTDERLAMQISNTFS